MQTASSARLPDGFMAAIWLGAEKPHQGVSTRNQAWHPAPNVCNSTTALGLRASTALNRVRSFYRGEQFDSDLGLYYLRARYYNPGTGRFLSRDPEDGDPTNPATLHKYLYAGGDPVNALDPTGRDSLLETVVIYAKRVLPVVSAVKACGLALYGLYSLINDALDNAYNLPGHKSVPEWKVIWGVITTAVACTAPYAKYLYGTY